MGAARLLAKGWIAFCLFAGAHALHRALAAYVPIDQAAASIGVCVRTTIPLSAGVVHEAGVPRRPSTSTRRRPAAPSPSSESVS